MARIPSRDGMARWFSFWTRISFLVRGRTSAVSKDPRSSGASTILAGSNGFNE